MIKLTSIQQALSLKGTISELAVIRSLQFMPNGYNHEKQGDTVLIQEVDVRT